MAEILIERGADINVKSSVFETPIFKAVHYEQIKMSEFLLKNKCDIGIIAFPLYTLFHVAASSKNPKFFYNFVKLTLKYYDLYFVRNLLYLRNTEDVKPIDLMLAEYREKLRI